MRLQARAVKLREQDESRLRRGDAEEGIDRDSSWVKRLQWVRHFQERDKLVVFQAAQWVNAKKPSSRQTPQSAEETAQKRAELTRLADSFDNEVDYCSWRLNSVPVETLQRLGSITAEALNGVPFSGKITDASIRKYQSVGHRYMGFCWQAFRLGREEAHAQLAIRFNDEQWRLLCNVMHELEMSFDAEIKKTRKRRRSIRSSSISSTTRSNSETDDDSGEDAEDEEIYSGINKFNEDNHGIPKQSPLDRAMFDFLVASIKQQIGGNPYDSPLLCFCAALGITERPLGFTEPQLYTGMLAGLIWWMRIIFLESTFKEESRNLHSVPLEAVLRFKEDHAAWMCLGTHTVTSTVIGWMAYGKGHRLKTGGQPTIRWADDGEAIFHNAERICVEDFKRVARDLRDSADKHMSSLFGSHAAWAEARDGLNLERVADSVMRVGAGQSFATNPKNDWLESGPNKIIGLLSSSLWDATSGSWKVHAIVEWQRKLRMLREDLMILTHIWGGQPGRGPELTTLRHSDSWQLIRNVFIQDGQVMIVTDRDKMKAIRENGRKVARFMPDAIGRIMVAYIVWAIPTERALLAESGLPEPQGEQLEFMWRHGSHAVWGTDRASRILANLMLAGTGVRIGIGRYRAITIELGRRIRGLVSQQAETQIDDDSNNDNVEIDAVTGEAVDYSGSWNIVWDLQATHGTKIARQHYAVHVGFPGRLQPEMISTYREISRLWHQFLEHDKELEAKGEGKGKGKWKRKGAALAHNEVVLAKRSKQVIVSQTETEWSEEVIVGGLRSLLGVDVEWQSEKQAESMRTIMRLREGETAIIVLPTGAGKSILFMLPAILRDGGTSIVVVPFVALMEDLISRAHEMGVDCIRFKTSLSAGRDGLQRAARLVVVSADVVSGAEFPAYMEGLICSGLLRRIFVDECHTAITDVGYRAKLAELRGLHRYNVPMVLLTATLPVVLEEWFQREMLAQRAVVVRDRTTKTNCRYRVEEVKARKGAVEARTAEVVAEITERMRGQEKGVIYCRSRGSCEAIAAEIGCGAHHSGMSEGERMEVRTNWISRRGSRWITATSGLGTGVDIQGITAVVHTERPYGLVDFVQQTGRGGRRAEEVVESVIIHDGRPGWVDNKEGYVEECNRSQMEAFMKTPGCRRAVLAAFMDGVGSESCRQIEGGESCDRCQVEGRTARIWEAFGREEGQRMGILFRWLDEVAGECAPCHVLYQHKKKYGVSIAPEAQRQHKKGTHCSVMKDYSELTKGMQWANLSCCFKCKLPLDWCEWRKDGEEDCTDLDKVLTVAMMPLKLEWAKKIAEEQLGADVTDRKAYIAWLTRRRRFHGKGGTNALAVWEGIVWEAYKQSGA